MKQPANDSSTKQRAARFLWLIGGHFCVALGIVGAFLPLLPTTPFLLLAAACYVRGSQRHYQWLMNNRLLGPILRDYQTKRGVTLKTKIVALSLMWASLLFSMTRTDKRFVEIVILVTGFLVTAIILRLRTIR
jgi:uncharacterized protein